MDLEMLKGFLESIALFSDDYDGRLIKIFTDDPLLGYPINQLKNYMYEKYDGEIFTRNHFSSLRWHQNMNVDYSVDMTPFFTMSYEGYYYSAFLINRLVTGYWFLFHDFLSVPSTIRLFGDQTRAEEEFYGERDKLNADVRIKNVKLGGSREFRGKRYYGLGSNVELWNIF